MSTYLTCTYDTTSDTLTVIDAFPTGLAAKSTYRLLIDSIRNPLSFAPITIALKTATSAGYSALIDVGTAALTMTSPAAIVASSSSIVPDDSTVQQLTNFKIVF